MRKGNGGLDMFESCLVNGVAAIHYPPVESVDLSRYSEDDLPPEWSNLESSQSGSLRKLAWRIRGGDTLFVAESYPSRLVGVGRVRGTGEGPAYRYWQDTAIVDDDGQPWRHVLDVDWEQDFEAISYPNPWAAQATVLDLDSRPEEIAKVESLLRASRIPKRRAPGTSQSNAESADELIQRRQLEDWAYTRYTKEAVRTIQRRHATICNAFTSWIAKTGAVKSWIVERNNIDLSFHHGGARYLVEFKVAYSKDPKPAIREALGQVLEYNYYPGRNSFDHWILVLDCCPTANDLEFLSRLRALSLPLSLGWFSQGEFAFSPGCPLTATRR